MQYVEKVTEIDGSSEKKSLADRRKSRRELADLRRAGTIANASFNKNENKSSALGDKLKLKVD